MQPLDFRDFIWQNKGTKTSYIILAITTLDAEDVIVFREAKDRNTIYVDYFDRFCNNHEATYELF